MCIDMCIDMCIGMCLDMCIDMRMLFSESDPCGVARVPPCLRAHLSASRVGMGAGVGEARRGCSEARAQMRACI